MNEPVTTAFLLAVKAQIEERMDAGHGRLRTSVNELTAETKLLHDQVLKGMTEREVERELAKAQKQEQRDRVVRVGTMTSLIVTVGLFLIRALLRHEGVSVP